MGGDYVRESDLFDRTIRRHREHDLRQRNRDIGPLLRTPAAVERLELDIGERDERAL